MKKPILKAILIIAITACVFLLPLTFVGDIESPAKNQMNLISKSPDVNYVVVIGDSRCHVGISPKKIESSINYTKDPVSVINLCVDGTDITHHYSVLRSIYKSGVRPQIVLWAVNPLQFSKKLVNNRIEQLHLEDIPALLRSGTPHEIVLDVITGRLMGPWAHRPKFKLLKSDYMERAAIRALPIQYALGLSRADEKPSRKYHQLEKGFEPFTIIEWEARYLAGLKTYREEYRGLFIDTWRLRMAKEIATLAKNYGSRLVVVELPVSSDYYNEFATGGTHQNWRDNLKNILAPYSVDYYDHTSLYLNRKKLFGDPGHMSMPLAEEYSIYLANSLNTSEYIVRNGFEYLGEL
jgi:hypothetical protein